MSEINPKLLKPYDPQETEPRIYDGWLKSGLFNPDVSIESGFTDPGAETFSMVLPPPNVTGTLHVGHAMVITTEDIIVRFNRMKGKRTLWVPGTDHAAIATQSKVEEKLFKENKQTRFDFTREDFLKLVESFASQSHDTIINQVRKVGASVDWSREAYTLDEKRSLAVRTAFKKMYDAGLIYQGSRIVNWDPKLKTTVSDEEIEWAEEKTPLYYLKYGPFVIATARPETKFGDKYVVMHPDDSRYNDYQHGQIIDVSWINGTVKATIIKDESIDMDFGTGVMTITPWHDSTDFEIAERHNLDKEQVIDFDGKLLSVAGDFNGQHIKKARSAIIERLNDLGLIEKIDEDYVHNIAKNSRGGGVIEPQIKKQWFIAVNKEFKMGPSKINGISEGDPVTLKRLMKEVVENGQVRLVPERFDKIYFHWVDNLRDWCISRQIWFGHRIPVWYDKTSGEIYCDIEPPKGENWEQDSDTLDTWFSSGLWPFSVLGWPEETADLANYHPLSVMATAYDLVFFWVARMILMSTYIIGDIPFKSVYFHGLVRDSKGRKMSKSLGNIIDPLTVIEKYGTDAVRLSLIIGTGPGNDSKFSEEKARGYKHFANKIWNATRFVLSNTKDFSWEDSLPDYTDEDAKTCLELDALVKEITGDMENFRFYMAGEKIYQYFWHTFADVVIENSKAKLSSADDKERKSAERLLNETLVILIKMLHPFMPFVTEEIWSFIPVPDKRPLLVERWPG